MALADSYLGRDSAGHYSNIQDAFLGIGCIDGSRTIDPAQAQQLAEKSAAAAPFLASGDPPAAVKDPCDFWPVPTEPLQPVTDVPGLPQVLVISTTHDPATPYQAGVNLARRRRAAAHGRRHEPHRLPDRRGTSARTRSAPPTWSR